jgi:hypothetical protein
MAPKRFTLMEGPVLNTGNLLLLPLHSFIYYQKLMAALSFHASPASRNQLSSVNRKPIGINASRLGPVKGIFNSSPPNSILDPCNLSTKSSPPFPHHQYPH